MKRLRLALLFGGVSGEHEVSCLSATSILSHLDRERYDVVLIGVTKTGRWYRQPSPPTPLAVREQTGHEVSIFPGSGFRVGGEDLGIDVVFPILHGIQGEDGQLQGLLGCAGVPYAGAGVLASALGMDKVMAKRLWQADDLPVVPWLSFRRGAWPRERASAFDTAQRTLGLPLFVKPSNSGSSVGVSKVTSPREFEQAMEAAFAIDSEALVETAVTAREIEVAVIGGDDARAFGPGEIVASHEFYDYDAKYIDPDGAKLLIPAPVSPEVSRQILELAVKAYRSLGTRGFARVDFFLSRNDDSIWINEINTLPGFTSISMFPRMAMTGARTYSQVLDVIIEQALPH